jgi:hypothetical protein
MKVVTVPAEETAVNKLLKSAGQGGLILQSAEGRQFVLVSMDKWAGFEVGRGNFEQEAALTGENQELIEFLARRRGQGPRIPLAEVREQLGLESGSSRSRRGKSRAKAKS